MVEVPWMGYASLDLGAVGTVEGKVPQMGREDDRGGGRVRDGRRTAEQLGSRAIRGVSTILISILNS